MVQNKVRLFMVQSSTLSLLVFLSISYSQPLPFFCLSSISFSCSLPQIYTISGLVSGAATQKSPLSLYNNRVTLKWSALMRCLSLSAFTPLVSPLALSSFGSLFLSPALFLHLPLTEPLYFRRKQSLYFPSHCPVLPQSETLIAGERSRQMRVKEVRVERVQHAGQEQERLHNGLLSSSL